MSCETYTYSDAARTASRLPGRPSSGRASGGDPLQLAGRLHGLVGENVLGHDLGRLQLDSARPVDAAARNSARLPAGRLGVDGGREIPGSFCDAADISSGALRSAGHRSACGTKPEI